MKTNLRVLMAVNNIRSLRELGELTGLSGSVIQKLNKEKDIETVQIGNLIAVAKALHVSLDRLIPLPWKTHTQLPNDPRALKELLLMPVDYQSPLTSNVRILMALKGITSLRELGKHSGVTWRILKSLDEGEHIDTIQLKNLLKVCAPLECSLDELLNLYTEEAS